MDKIIPVLIRKKRTELGWSQETLCRGICAVSYLSKLENGLLEASEEIEQKLLQRLGLEILSQPELVRKAEEEIDAFYHVNLFMPYTFPFSEEETRILTDSRYFLDVLLMQYFCGLKKEEDLDFYISWLEPEQIKRMKQIQVAQGKCEPRDLINAWPEGYSYYLTGRYYFNRAEYMLGSYYFIQAYDMACIQGDLDLMVDSRICLHSCHCGKNNQDLAEEELLILENLLKNDPDRNSRLSISYYNMAAMYTLMDESEKMLYYLDKVNPECTEKPWIVFHKIGIAHENLGHMQEAREALEQGLKYAPESIELQILAYRLDHPDYLRDRGYEKLLRKAMKSYNPVQEGGYYKFHMRELTRVLESQFRYKEAYELLREITEW